MPVTAIADLPLLENVALGLLMIAPKHGYALYRDFSTLFGTVYDAGRSKFYARLNDLQEAGYLSAELIPQANHPPRKIYHVTSAGEARFRQWLHQPIDAPRHIRVIAPVKLRLFRLLGERGAQDFLEAQIAACRSRLDREADRAETAVEAGGDEAFADMLHELRRQQLIGMIAWLEYCKSRVDA
jgi:DNA-binding PadR family transcriptional regulator